MKQPWAWVSWLVATLAVLSITRNPLYLLLVLMCVLIVGLRLGQLDSGLPRPFSLWKLAAWIILLATIFNAATSHYGQTVLFSIPGRLPLISGNVTLEAIVYGVINGLVLTGMLASFMVLNQALPVRDLISLIPRAFFPAAVVTSIAVTYLPTTLRQFQQIREAQAIRGHQMHTLKDWLPLWMPLLVGGLEHAMQLAEAMTARGFASTSHVKRRSGIYLRLCMVGGLVLLALGWLAQLGGASTAGLTLITVGACLILGGLCFLGRQSPRTVYRHAGWSWRDGLMVIIAISVVVICLAPIHGLDRQTLNYEPYPTLSLPPFSLLLGVVLLVLIVPGLLVIPKNPDVHNLSEGKQEQV